VSPDWESRAYPLLARQTPSRRINKAGKKLLSEDRFSAPTISADFPGAHEIGRRRKKKRPHISAGRNFN
jgi:hypothetical protein